MKDTYRSIVSFWIWPTFAFGALLVIVCLLWTYGLEGGTSFRPADCLQAGLLLWVVSVGLAILNELLGQRRGL